MDADKAASEVAKLLRQMHNLLAEKIKFSSRKDIEQKAFAKRESDFKRAGGAQSQFPTVVEAFQRNRNHYKQNEEKLDTDIAKTDALLDQITTNYAPLLVKTVGEIKIRQVVELARTEIGKLQKPAPDDRFQKLEQQLTSLKETQGAQAASISKLLKKNEEQATSLRKLEVENEGLRSRHVLYETQAGELATLRSEYERLQREVNSGEVQIPGFEALKQEKEQLGNQVSGLQAQLETLFEQVKSQQAEFATSLQQVRSQASNDRIESGWAARMADLERQVKEHDSHVSGFPASVTSVVVEKTADLEQRVNEHDKHVSSFDINEYSEAVDKLLAFPNWADLDGRLQGLENRIQRLSDAHQDDLRGIQGRPDENFGMRNEQATLRRDLIALREELTEANKANEAMILNLDKQFQNMSTLDMAHIIMEQLKRLAPASVSMDVQNLHERLADVESFKKDQAKRNEALKKFTIDATGAFSGRNGKRSQEDDMLSGREEKRQRVDGLNGAGNGLVVRQTSLT